MAYVQVTSSCKSTGFVQKTVFSNATRLLMAVGLEGTGHNFMQKLLTQLPEPEYSERKSKGCMNSVARHGSLACLITLKGDWNQGGLERDVRNKDFAGLGWSRSHIEENAKYLKSVIEMNPGWIIAVAPLGTSWPNGHGSHKAREGHMRPNLAYLAEAAELAGVDLRLMVLQRDPLDTLTANCLHRYDLESCPNQAATLRANAFDLAEQLANVDPAFYRWSCVRYGDLNQTARGLHAMVMGATATLGREADSAVKCAFTVNKRRPMNKNHAMTNSEMKELAGTMVEPLEKIAALCHKAADCDAPIFSAAPAACRSSRSKATAQVARRLKLSLSVIAVIAVLVLACCMARMCWLRGCRLAGRDCDTFKSSTAVAPSATTIGPAE
eukprot:TRINITY_DN12054_c0_g2_i1.p1 TRINITY_DN12054_c0_g2~~TRINITY_DN12054_c0_g2_i1.p1  ORF type:complete len:383 (+),score=66.71 TRINITY_DN12054_c0_g2_i1:232-1380(+)